jgi:hypothetical protein
MDYYQGVVTEYLRADRSLFVNTEYCIQINAGDNPDRTGPHWYCDAVAINPGSKNIFLCEISYSKTLQGLLDRLGAWNEHWTEIGEALRRDSRLTGDWTIQPWLFVPLHLVEKLQTGLAKMTGESETLHFNPIITTLESVQPWKYDSWNRTKEEPKRDCISDEMRS